MGFKEKKLYPNFTKFGSPRITRNVVQCVVRNPDPSKPGWDVTFVGIRAFGQVVGEPNLGNLCMKTCWEQGLDIVYMPKC